jgi:ubiquitin-protein ligase
MNIREKRLQYDYKDLSKLIADSTGDLKLISQQGNPPYKYVIEYRCKGIEKLGLMGKPVYRNTHQVEIVLGNNYPKEQPSAKFLTPIFHPNVWKNNTVCLGSYWTMSETLRELVIRIGKIIQYSKDVLNLNSPANSDAKNWAGKNMNLFPVDRKTFKALIVWRGK